MGIDVRSAALKAPWALALAGMMALVGGACSSGDDGGGEAPQGDGGGEAPAAETPAAGGQTPAVAALTAEQLRPVFSNVSGAGVAPRAITVAFSRDVFSDDIQDVGWRQEISIPTSPETVLEVSPATAGQLTITSANTLTFTPDVALKPNTEYKVELKSVRVGEATFAEPSAGAWATAFTTPRFGFVRMDLASYEPDRGAADLNLVFSYPVSAKAAASFISLTLDGKPIKPLGIVPGSQPNVVKVGIKQPSLGMVSGEVGLSLKAGVPMAADPSLGAPSATASLTIKRGEPIEILATRRLEADSGHYLDIICYDHAAPGDERWYWDDVNYDSYEVSSRCELTEAAVEEHVHFDPAVSFYAAPSDAGFRLFGDFKRGTYNLRIDAGARSIDGGLLSAAYETQVSIPARSPRVSFVSKGRYLPREAWGNLAVSHLNVSALGVTVRHIPPENLVFWMSDSSEAATSRNSNVLAKKNVSVPSPEDTEVTSWLDVASMVPEPEKGVYEISVTGGPKEDSARLLLTDMNLIAKANHGVGPDGWPSSYSVWALDMDTAAGLPGVTVKAVRQSGEELARCTTSGDGGCALKIPEPGVDPSGPFALIATLGKDLTYLKFTDLKAPVDAEQVQGEPFGKSVPYRASIYSDRGVYRPGETAHVVAILRAEDNRTPGVDMPVTLELVDPRGAVARRMELRTNGAGMINADLAFEAYAGTGRYEVRLTAGKKAAGSYSFNVEEFVPERMKVEVKSAEAAWLAADPPRFDVDARYLFGGTAAGSPVEVSCYIEASTFKPKNNGQYEYAVFKGEDAAKRLSLGTVSAELDDQGHAEIACPASGGGGVVGPSRVVADVAVFEAGSGRTTHGSASAPVHPERYYLGLSTSADKAHSGQPVAVEGVVVDWDGNLVTDALTTLDMRYLRLEAEYNWYWYDESDEESFVRHLRAIPWGKDQVAVKGGRFSFKVTPTSQVDALLVRVRAGGAQTDLQLEGEYRYWWGSSDSQINQTPRPMKPTALTLDAAGPARVGQPLTVKVDAPYKGRMLFTAETNEVLTSEWKDVQAGPVEWTFTPKAFSPNVYLSALLVKDPHLDSAEAYRPDRAFGVTSVKVAPEAFTFNLKMDVPKEVRSNSPLKVDLDLGGVDGPTFVTVAAVDEGILSLTSFQDPDPFKAIFAQRGLGVETFETVGWTLLVPPGGPSSAHGGDEGGDLGRVQPVKPVALWAGVVEVPKSGKVSVTFDVPQYRGSLRVMAVAAGEARMGAASASVPVRDPLVLQTTLPRFLTDGDEIQIPVFVTNLSGAARDVVIHLESESLAMPGLTDGLDPIPPLQLLGAREGSLRLADGANGTVVFQARARKKVGAARLKVEARAGDLVSFEELEVPFSPNGPTERVVQRIELTQGKNDVTPYLTGWVPTTEQSTLWVTSNPYGQSLDHLKALVHYPYGCIEQTTSSTRPLLYVSNLLYNVDPSLVANASIEKMVSAGISRVLSMQTPEGGFSYWPGGREPVWWGTAYATHMLLDAQRLGYGVSPTAMDAVMTWIEGELNSSHNSDRSYYWGSFDRAEPYLHYVLALGGKGRKARIQQLIDGLPPSPTGEIAEEAYLLKAALYLSGDHRYEADLKSPDVSSLDAKRTNSWSFYSDLRRRGFVLNVFQDLFGADPKGEPLADLVARGLARERSWWYSTQELVWGVTGLGRWVNTTAGAFDPPTLAANGKDREPQLPPEGQKVSDRTWNLARASEYKSLVVNLPGAKAEHVYLMLMSEGIREGATWAAGGEGLSLSRTYKDANGEPLDLGQLSLGDMVFVELSLTNTSLDEIKNVALVDRLPSGFEIENPRLGRGGSSPWVDELNLWESDYLNLRDDRVEVFGTIPRKGTVTVVYAARAVTAGSFTVPPASAEAMYEPSLWSRTPGQEALISGPWADFLL